jgi:PleD family two-component response regulator
MVRFQPNDITARTLYKENHHVPLTTDSRNPSTMEQHILIVDDDTQELRRLRELLTRAGYNIMTATDKATAERIMEKITISFILMRSTVKNAPTEGR